MKIMSSCICAKIFLFQCTERHNHGTLYKYMILITCFPLLATTQTHNHCCYYQRTPSYICHDNYFCWTTYCLRNNCKKQYYRHFKT